MTRQLAKWVSKRGQTAEIRPSVLVGGNSLQLRRTLGTIAMDLKAIWEMSVDINSILLVYSMNAIKAIFNNLK